MFLAFILVASCFIFWPTLEISSWCLKVYWMPVSKTSAAAQPSYTLFFHTSLNLLSRFLVNNAWKMKKKKKTKRTLNRTDQLQAIKNKTYKNLIQTSRYTPSPQNHHYPPPQKKKKKHPVTQCSACRHRVSPKAKKTALGTKRPGASISGVRPQAKPKSTRKKRPSCPWGGEDRCFLFAFQWRNRRWNNSP